ncbi:MAG: hemolysin family protein [Bacilli bacterium]|nr:hemolysin family protein [Bacilli bacterium]
MSQRAIIYLVVIFVLLILSFFFSSADMTYSVAPINKLKQEASKGKKDAKEALKLSKKYEDTIVTLLFGNSLVNILASSIATLFAYDVAIQNGVDQEIAELITTIVLLGILLIFGEILPKAFARSHSYALSKLFVPPVKFFTIIFYPVCKVSTFLAKKMVKPVIDKVDIDEAGPTIEELSSMVDSLSEEGFIDEDQGELVKASIEFNTIDAGDIMAPRVRIVGIEESTNLYKYIKEPNAFSRSRLIVYKGDLDHIIGYLPTKSLQKAIINDKKLILKDLMLPIVSVPSTMEVSSVLKIMKETKHHIVVVRDEYGGTDGIVTMEDILEEIVGELYDESEAIPFIIEKQKGRNTYKVSGNMELKDFNEKFKLGLNMDEVDVDTVSGWVNSELGKFASPGDSFKYKKIDVTVLSSDKYTVKLLKVVYHPRRNVK